MNIVDTEVVIHHAQTLSDPECYLKFELSAGI